MVSTFGTMNLSHCPVEIIQKILIYPDANIEPNPYTGGIVVK
jgi:hypothetical protein